MLVFFNEKVIISRTEAEHYFYKTRPVMRGYRRAKEETAIDSQKKQSEKSQPVVKKIKTKKEQTEKQLSAVRRSRNSIRRIVNSNPQLNKFLTLTSKMTDVKQSNNCFNRFIERMKDRFPEFQYFAVLEFQKDVDYFGKKKEKGGAVHYHLLCNLRYVESNSLAKIWGHGFIKIKRVDQIKNLGRYISKYLQKDMFDKRMFGKKKFFHSQNLRHPIELIGAKSQLFMKKEENNLKFIREYEFETEYQGKILYSLYDSKKIDFNLISHYAS